MPDLLLELFSEEIPARMQARAADDLARAVTTGLTSAGLAFETVEAFATPRRLALIVSGIPDSQPDKREERRGPRVGAPDKAVEGFLRSVGLARDEIEQRETGKGRFYYAIVETRGRPTVDVLMEVLPKAVSSVSWPKSMRWADHAARWVRPLHSILCLFDREVLPFTWHHLTAGDMTRGHRFMAPDAFRVSDPAGYLAGLHEAFVVLDAGERKKTILREARKLAEAESLSLVEDAALADEVAGLVEWPVVLLGRIDPAFMSVPREVLTSAMRGHQRYFALEDGQGAMAPRFLVVANLAAADGGRRIIDGNERVLAARLADARFFWDQDRKAPLQSRVDALADIVFHEKLGTLSDKTARIEALAGLIAREIEGADAAEAAHAARLAKADLSTGMVGEFPELQGLMGRYYALHDGLAETVADAIRDHYAPMGPGDACPTAPVSVAVALADKIDTLVGFWLIDEKPTGSKDPYALRRAALGVIRLVLENGLRIRLLDVFARAGAQYAKELRSAGAAEETDVHRDLLAFLADRLKVHLRERGVRHDLVSAVFALHGEDDLVRLLARVEALGKFLASDDGANLLVAYRRAANILRIEETKDGKSYARPARPELLKEKAEHALHGRLEEVSGIVDGALKRGDFESAGQASASLRGPVDAFFDHVTVNTDDADLRENRLCLLSMITSVLNRLADFSKIEG